MLITNERQALCIAVEMEKRAIRIYERAQMITQNEEVRAGIEEILKDEREHLCRFNAMRSSYPITEQEEQQLLSGMAAETLMPGGVMELHREKALQTLSDLYRYAAESEAQAVKTYADFAKKCTDSTVCEAFLSIAHEETAHLHEIEKKKAQELPCNPDR